MINPGALAVDPTNPSTVYVGGVLGIYKSVDSGSIWRLVSTNLGSSLITALVIDPRNSATLYAADYGGRGILQPSPALTS